MTFIFMYQGVLYNNTIMYFLTVLKNTKGFLWGSDNIDFFRLIYSV